MVKNFAYGSNMDQEDLDEWCERHGYHPIRFSSIKVATLEDYKLSFNYFSRRRKGGVANITPCKDSYVQGLLVDLKECDVEKLRKKELYPKVYDEIMVDVEVNGKVVKDVVTYKIIPSKEEDFQKPTEYYLGLIIKSAKKYNFNKYYIEMLENIVSKE